jgi:signal transduction histidine kinase
MPGMVRAGRAEGWKRTLAWAIFLTGGALVLAGSAFLVRDVANGSLPFRAAVSQWALLPPAAAFSIVGLVVALRRPGNPCGWLMLAVGTVWSIGVSPPSPKGTLLEWASAPGWIPPFGIMGTHLLLRLPNGTLLSPRWRIVSRISTAAVAVTMIGFWFDPSLEDNPIANARLSALAVLGLLVLALCIVLSVISLVIRARRAGPEERHQIRWIAVGAIVFLISWGIGFLANAVAPDRTLLNQAVTWIALTGYAAVPVGIGFAILQYRLYDIDIVIRKAVVFGLLAAFITAVYAAIVAAVSLRFEATQVGSFAAAATLAVLFAPARDRARRIADRLVYGTRATPYEVLAEFSERVGETYADEDVLSRMAQVLMDGTGASGARVLLRVGPERRAAATVGEPTGEETLVEVTHQGEVLGALAVSMPPADPMNPAKLTLVEDLASQAGLVLRNVKLIEELKASRQRLVAAQDEERRKIERNIHDGAQQQLVALSVQLRLAAGLVGKDPAKERELLSSLTARANEALGDLRDLARGIYPPLLADKGLTASLEAQARKAAVPTTVNADGIGRFSQEVESAVYFCTLEAMNNVAKYAEASHARIALAQTDGHVTFTVTDDGRGFDPAETGYGTGLQGMADRLDAIGGTLEIETPPGGGTVVRGRVPTA